ncbi:MAG: TetR/AcrR family transcriptional regulator [bacterium]|nr:TetR/AcrR family transcriptional regulator [bacterium]
MATEAKRRRRSGSEETARRVLEAAAAEFVERGYDKAVISNIARRAGVTPGAVYPRWPHKSDLMAAALDHLFQRLLPEQRIRDMGIAELPATVLALAWAGQLLKPEETKDVLVQVFGSARNNPIIEERLQAFLNDQAHQLSMMIERGKDEGFCDPEQDTTAITLLCQAIGIGTHLLLAAGLADRYIPSEQDWLALFVKMIGSVAPGPTTESTG